MEKGLGDAIKEVYPGAEHRVCIRHLWKNLKKNFHCKDGHKLQGLVWAAAGAYTITEFNDKLAELSVLSPSIYVYLTNLPYKWSRSQFILGIYHATNTSNLAESFNAWIVDARNKPVVDLVDMIRSKLMEQRAARKLLSITWQRDLVPNAEDYIREVTTRKEHMLVRQSTHSKAEVESIHSRHIVDLESKECTCRIWQLTGLPCIHAVAYIGMKEHPLWHTYVHDWYRMAYEGAIGTLPDKDQWLVVQNVVDIGHMKNCCNPGSITGKPVKLKHYQEKLL
ncbi:uncharacterized protein LOC110100134 [Dendrobium catenatum]|uniref:uncharacterized protein LOC110100134 n=1 Tax=Dendrobium catenatum TaxID=906689 RepID=UPI00109F3AF7|nr:uncharacterized protein LOC110100134 [Dendrobium catenatum]